MKRNVFQTKEEPVQCFYTIDQFQEDVDQDGCYIRYQEDEYTFAKIESSKCNYTQSLKTGSLHNTQYKYYIKCDMNKQILNPLSPIPAIPKKSIFMEKTCKPYIFQTVSKNIFQKYVNFLKTANIRLLKEAQRNIQ